MKNCGTGAMKQYTATYKPATGTDSSKPKPYSCLLKEQAFKDAGVPHLFPRGSSTAPPTPASAAAEQAVALSKGHGFFEGACGSTAFVRQGPNPNPDQDSPYSTNTLLNVQIGTRAWSGEITDSNGGTQQYINQGYQDSPAGDHAAFCLQPLIMRADEKEVDKVLQHVAACTEGTCPASTAPVDAGAAAPEQAWDSCYFMSSGMAVGAQCSSPCTADQCSQFDGCSVEDGTCMYRGAGWCSSTQGSNFSCCNP